jgi:hypothetical protein
MISSTLPNKTEYRLSAQLAIIHNTQEATDKSSDFLYLI